MRHLFIFSILILFSISIKAQIINVPPPNGVDDTANINNAINSAGSNATVQFQSGTYKVKGKVGNATKNASIYVNKKNNITIKGVSVGTNGTPVTKIVRILDAPNTNVEQPAPIYLEQCNNVKIEDISFNNESPHATAGIVKAKGSNYFEVEIFNGLPLDEGCKFTAGNVWDNTGNLKKVGSLSYSSSYGTGTIVNQSQRRIRINLTNTSTLSYINVWDRISWHYGTAGRAMIYVNGGSNITLDNTDVYNTLRSAIFIAYVNNLTIKNVDIKPIGNHLASSPRDGIHSSRIQGNYLVENCTIEGTRLDAFVVLGTFAKTFNKINNRKIQIKTDNAVPGFVSYDISLPLLFIDENGEKVSVNVQSANKLANNGGKSVYEINTSQDIPSFVAVGTTVIPRGLTTRSVKTKNNSYRNIAGASELLYTYNTISENNTHTNIMYPAVRMGANAKKGYPGSKYIIRNSSFTDCAWEQHGLAYNLEGYIATENNSIDYDGVYVNDITINNNTFTSTMPITNKSAVQLKEAYDINIFGNTFNGFTEPVKFDTFTVRDININNNVFGANNIITKKININKDTFVKGGSSANNNYGGYSFTETKQSSNNNYERITFLNYNLPDIPSTVSEAKLYLYSQGTNSVKARQNIKVANNNSWNEYGITHNNKPSYSYANGYAGLDANANYTGWITKNINSTFNFRPISNGITLVLEESTSTSSIGTFATKEGSFKGDSFLLLKYIASGFQSKSLSTDEVAISDKIKYTFYPNPISGDIAKIFVSNSQESLESYELFNINGSRILKNYMHKGVKNNLSQQEYKLSIGDISKGIYFIKLNTKTNSKILKFIKR